MVSASSGAKKVSEISRQGRLRGAPAGAPQELLLPWDSGNSKRRVRALGNKKELKKSKNPHEYHRLSYGSDLAMTHYLTWAFCYFLIKGKFLLTGFLLKLELIDK